MNISCEVRFAGRLGLRLAVGDHIFCVEANWRGSAAEGTAANGLVTWTSPPAGRHPQLSRKGSAGRQGINKCGEGLCLIALDGKI